MKVEGGGDFCETIFEGFKAISKLNSKEETFIYLFHIADAPPHGELYHGSDLDYFFIRMFLLIRI